ncbi:alpha/beta-hydrolase [Punctularia strigosozonata HHB-11173 SS5]|uniref:alpha/beta-hydrolase n=1 Tax=Punctularia strigosozonata (strain HHB-11173) TaxID=741275 RepID=UPI0004417260|nr:alpha/beta-hydrolase [Punctularia strigosozonata HHB-11173 SS5]EIN12211.1 alpha/beta-hydrolase [Punctularia strigosozonata HHB-11173 SS5]
MFCFAQSSPISLQNVHDSFVALSHPHFPKHAVRIKQTDFCDPTVNVYSGYVDITGAKHLFFVYFESRRDPANDDVVLWLNGGPGGSGTLGMLMELGPCTVASANSTKLNPYSWNNEANLLFVEQPVGVGYSYAEYGETVYTTADAAKDIAAFLAILANGFSEFGAKPFHIAGESYGGRYVPWFAAELFDLNAELTARNLTAVNLQSILIGPNILAAVDMQCTDASGLPPVQPIKTCIRMKQVAPRCKKWYTESCKDSLDVINCGAAISFCDEELTAPFLSGGMNPYDLSKKCTVEELMDNLCYPISKNITALLNQPWVRAELGVDPIFDEQNITYTPVSWTVNQGFAARHDHMYTTEGHIAALLERGIKVLIYVGEYDVLCNWLGNLHMALNLEWTGAEGFEAAAFRGWEVEEGGGQVGKVRASGGLTFATVAGAGHMVPYDKPKEALAMFNRWLEGRPL